MMKSMKKVANNQVLQLCEPGKSVANLASVMLAKDNFEISKKFCNNMYDMIKYHRQLRKEEMFQKFHQIAMDPDMIASSSYVRSECEDFDEKIILAMYQFVINNFFDRNHYLLCHLKLMF